MLQWYLWPLRRKAPEISLTSLFLWDLNSTSRGVDSLDWIIILFSRWNLYWNSYHFEDYFSQCATWKNISHAAKKIKVRGNLSDWICKLFVIYIFSYVTLSFEKTIFFMVLQKQIHEQTNSSAKVRRKMLWDRWPKLCWWCMQAPYLLPSLLINQRISWEFMGEGGGSDFCCFCRCVSCFRRCVSCFPASPFQSLREEN